MAGGNRALNIKLTADKKIAETSSKGNQEKWLENSTWYKLDQFGYEALAEVMTSKLLEHSNIESETPFTFVRYEMKKVKVHGRERTACASKNFLKNGQSILTVNALFRQLSNQPLTKQLAKLPSDKKRMEYLAHSVTEMTGLADFGKNNVFYIIMEWINGKTLREKQKASDRQFIRWMADLCDILNELDKYHYHHKDIKPENLMITNDNRIYLIDFNISVSLPNMLEGTANYKAPEMDWDSKYVSRDRSDMFSIGVIMYERFTGELPLLCEHYGNPVGNGKEWGDFIEPKEVRSDIDPEINKIITRCMKLNPKSRFNSYGELAKALRGVKYAAKENKHGTGKNRKGFSQKGRGNSRYGNY